MFNYTYTGRNQLKSVTNWATYTYDENGFTGELTTRALLGSASGTRTTYNYDGLNRVTWVSHYFRGASGGFNYGYYDNSDNRKFTRRLPADVGDVFRYDLADQAIGVQLNVATPQNVQSIGQTINYDANGNRTSFSPYGPTDTYYLDNNSLNQYNRRNNISAFYDTKGNLTNGFDGSAYAYDAQNRLTSVSKSGLTLYFKYDGLNRQVSRTLGNSTTFSIWDGWDLIEEYGAATATYLYGASGLIAGVTNGQFNYYFQDGTGSTSHLTNSSGQLLEWYRYDLQGTPFFYDANNNQRSASAYGVRHLFTGQQWYSGTGLYDLRNRFYSPDIGRFLQSDPIGFGGGKNLYRYCGNNPVTRWDPSGLTDAKQEATLPRIYIPGDPIPGDISPTGFLPGDFGWPGIPFDIEPFIQAGLFGSREIPGVEFHLPESVSVQHPAPSSVPPQNPPQPSIDPLHATTTAEFIAIGNAIEHGNTMDTWPAFDLIDLLSGGIAGLARSSIRSVAVERTAVFWAGGRAAENAARTFARANNGIVIGDTAAGRALAQSTANVPWSQARPQWLSLSEDFARSASGEVNVFQNARGVAVDSMWRNEYQILMQNPNVTGINFSVVMPDGSVVPVP
jgi:RHS repeat-associated protein